MLLKIFPVLNKGLRMVSILVTDWLLIRLRDLTSIAYQIALDFGSPAVFASRPLLIQISTTQQPVLLSACSLVLFSTPFEWCMSNKQLLSVDSQRWPPVAVGTSPPHPSWHLWHRQRQGEKVTHTHTSSISLHWSLKGKSVFFIPSGKSLMVSGTFS